MKRLLQAAATAVIVAAAFSPAQAVVIGTADSENAIPFGSSNSGANFVYQQVYNKTDFSGAIDITSISFYDNFGTAGWFLARRKFPDLPVNHVDGSRRCSRHSSRLPRLREPSLQLNTAGALQRAVGFHQPAGVPLRSVGWKPVADDSGV